MKNLMGFAVCGALLIAAYGASAEDAKSCYATVVRVQGLASYSLGDNVWYPLVPGKYLPPGSSVRTGDDSTADLVMEKVTPQAGSYFKGGRAAVGGVGSVPGLMNAFKPSVEQNVVRT